mgnify:CR=1 FL=1
MAAAEAAGEADPDSNPKEALLQLRVLVQLVVVQDEALDVTKHVAAALDFDVEILIVEDARRQARNLYQLGRT